jgi:hypothetical protein
MDSFLKKILWSVPVAFVILLSAWYAPVFAAHPFLLRDHPGINLAAPGQWEISLEYLLMNNAADIFGFRNEEIKTITPDLRSATLGDLHGGRLLVNYGLFSRTTLHGEYSYRDVDLNVADFQVHSLEFSLRQGLAGYGAGGGGRWWRWMPGCG